MPLEPFERRTGPVNRDEDGWFVACWDCGEVGPLAPSSTAARQAAKEAGFARNYRGRGRGELYKCPGCRSGRKGTPAQVLAAVTGPVTAVEIAARLDIDETTAASTLLVLNRRGLLRRQYIYSPVDGDQPMTRREMEAGR